MEHSLPPQSPAFSSGESSVLNAYCLSGKLRRSSSRQSKSAGRLKHKSTERNRVLLLGRIRELALYRAEVLRERGFQVIAPTGKEDALAAIRQGDFNVAVLSYTLSSDTVQEFADEVREHCPECPVIAIARSNAVDRRVAPDLVVVADEGPAGLLAALRRVLLHT